MYGREAIGSLFRQSLVARRQQSHCYSASTVLEFEPQHFQQAGREHGIAVLLAFALPYPDEHAFGIDIAYFQGHDLGDAQAASVGGHQRGAIANRTDMLEELLYFDRAEDYRQLVWNAASRQHPFRPGRLQSHVVKEFSGCHEVVD